MLGWLIAAYPASRASLAMPSQRRKTGTTRRMARRTVQRERSFVRRWRGGKSWRVVAVMMAEESVRGFVVPVRYAAW